MHCHYNTKKISFSYCFLSCIGACKCVFHSGGTACPIGKIIFFDVTCHVPPESVSRLKIISDIFTPLSKPIFKDTLVIRVQGHFHQLRIHYLADFPFMNRLENSYIFFFKFRVDQS